MAVATLSQWSQVSLVPGERLAILKAASRCFRIRSAASVGTSDVASGLMGFDPVVCGLIIVGAPVGSGSGQGERVQATDGNCCGLVSFMLSVMLSVSESTRNNWKLRSGRRCLQQTIAAMVGSVP